jgi:cardiolipin synthase
MQPIRLLFWVSFSNARKRLWICNSYFIPDERLRGAVIDRAKHGVDVRILVPGNHTDAVPVQAAGRSYYEELLSAGVRIFEFQPSMMHAKTAVVDSAWSIVGSANLDERSMELNEENVLGVADADFALEIERGVTEDFARSREILLEEWRKRSLIRRGLERVCKVLIEQY